MTADFLMLTVDDIMHFPPSLCDFSKLLNTFVLMDVVIQSMGIVDGEPVGDSQLNFEVHSFVTHEDV